MKKIYLLFLILLLSCTKDNVVEVVNSFEGSLKSKNNLVESNLKRFKLDSITAAKPKYMSLVFNDSTKKRELTFINDFAHSIQFYDYENLSFIKKIKIEKSGNNGITKPSGYYIKNKDSIYVYNMNRLELFLINSKGKILNKKSLIGTMDIKKSPWFEKYPQYMPTTVTPLLGIDKGLLIMGQFMGDVPEKIINTFKYTTFIDDKLKQTKLMFKYPKELYGSNYFWGDPVFSQVFYDVVPTAQGKSKIVFSFPVSHDIYLSEDINSQNLIKKYAGSNYAKTISSLNVKNNKKIKPLELRTNYMKNDLYGAILYDKYRNVYYRFIRRGVKESLNKFESKDKPIAVIIYDNQFNYLGETDLGLAKEYHWENSFVSKEGLNIEWIDAKDIDEIYLNLKIFVLKEI